MRYLALVSILLAPVLGSGCKQVPVAGFCDVEGDSRCGAGEVCDVQAKACILDPANTPCTGDGECPARGPVCTPEGICGECEDGDDLPCMENHEGRPRCEPVSGACVQCLERSDCDGDTPACDTLNNECVECADHGDCTSGACDIEAKTCVPEADVVRVEMGGSDGTCAPGSTPCATINGALDAIDATRRTIVMAPGIYRSDVTISGVAVGSQRITIIGPEATIEPESSNRPGVFIDGSADVLMDGVTIQDAAGGVVAYGVQCRGDNDNKPTLTLFRARVATNERIGLDIDDCNIVLSRVTVESNTQGGIRIVRDSTYSITNTLFHLNGNAGADVGAAEIDVDGARAPQVFDFNTIVVNTSQEEATLASGVNCEKPVTGVGNLFFGNANMTSFVGQCTFTYSNLETEPVAGEGNVSVSDPLFGPIGFRLLPESPLRDVPDFTPDKVPSGIDVDIDGDRRPLGALLDIGADEVRE